MIPISERDIASHFFPPVSLTDQDGPGANSVRSAVQAGVSYATAAGNDALSHLEQPFCLGPGGFHDFVCGTGSQHVQMHSEKLGCLLRNFGFGLMSRVGWIDEKSECGC